MPENDKNLKHNFCKNELNGPCFSSTIHKNPKTVLHFSCVTVWVAQKSYKFNFLLCLNFSSRNIKVWFSTFFGWDLLNVTCWFREGTRKVKAIVYYLASTNQTCCLPSKNCTLVHYVRWPARQEACLCIPES